MGENQKSGKEIKAECEEHLMAARELLKQASSSDMRPSDVLQIYSVAEDVMRLAAGAQTCLLYRRIGEQGEERDKYRQMLAHADRKAEHGCTDAYCPICDEGKA